MAGFKADASDVKDPDQAGKHGGCGRHADYGGQEEVDDSQGDDLSWGVCAEAAMDYKYGRMITYAEDQIC